MIPMENFNDRLVMHLDLDAFFASVEQRDQAEYAGKPLVVGARPGNRGVVATCSYEARRYGIRSAMPISEAVKLCPHAIFVRPDMKRYNKVSSQVFEVLREVSPVIEKASIDEAYIDISGLRRLLGSPREIAMQAKQRIQQQLRLTCSVGVGPNRLIAKLASEFRKPDGCTVILPHEVQRFLDPMPIRNLRGVGKQTGKIFSKLGISDVRTLRQYSLESLKHHFGTKAGMSFYAQARGQASAEIRPASASKSISKETTFAVDQADIAVLKNGLHTLSSSVARSARSKQLTATVVVLKVRFPDFETVTRQQRLPLATNNDREIFETVWQLYRQNGFEHKPLRLIGVGLSGLQSAGESADLFVETEQRIAQGRLYHAMDKINSKYGAESIGFGSHQKVSHDTLTQTGRRAGKRRDETG